MFNLSARANVKVGIDQSDYCLAANRVRLPVARIRAVDDTESAGSGFGKSKRPKILFEGHVFYAKLKRLGLAQKAATMDPSICYPSWTKVHYIGGEGEYGRLAKAAQICRALGVSDGLALMSASWGRYQIMGGNFVACGFNSVEQMVEAMFLDEDNHLEAFCEYIIENGLDDLLRVGNYERFAARYNGPGYRRNAYHIKIPAAVRKFEKLGIDCSAVLAGEVIDVMPGIRIDPETATGLDNTSLDDRHFRVLRVGMKGDDVGEAQERLLKYGYIAPNGVDKIFGPKMKEGVVGFQSANGLDADGVIGEKTHGLLFAEG